MLYIFIIKSILRLKLKSFSIIESMSSHRLGCELILNLVCNYTKIMRCDVHISSFWCEIHARFSINSHQLQCGFTSNSVWTHTFINTELFWIGLILIILYILFSKEIGECSMPESQISLIRGPKFYQFSLLPHKCTTYL